MPATNAGAVVVAAMMIGEATTDLNAANAYIGVGDSATAFAASQTDLQAATNKLRKGMNATYPQRASGVITLQTTFIETEAVWTWAEWGVFNAVSSGTMFSRLVQALGVKPNTELWRLTISWTVAAA